MPAVFRIAVLLPQRHLPVAIPLMLLWQEGCALAQSTATIACWRQQYSHPLEHPPQRFHEDLHHAIRFIVTYQWIQLEVIYAVVSK